MVPKLTLTETDLEAYLAPHFPRYFSKGPASGTVLAPKAEFFEETNEIRLCAPIVVNLLGLERRGLIGVRGRVVYASEKKSFQVAGARIDELTFEGVSETPTYIVRRILSGVVQDMMNRQPIYTFPSTAFSSRLIARSIRRVIIRDGRLCVDFGNPFGRAHRRSG